MVRIMILIKDVVEACKKLGWRCNGKIIRDLVVLMITEGVLNEEQLKIVAQRTQSNKIRRAAELKLARASKNEILIALEAML